MAAMTTRNLPGTMLNRTFLLTLSVSLLSFAVLGAEAPKLEKAPTTEAQLFSLSDVRLLDGPFTSAVKANQSYLLAVDPDRLLAPFRREAGLQPRKPTYQNWENSGLDGHTGGHYLSALANMIASGNDTKEGEFRRRLDYMIEELDACQKAYGDGYIGGVPGSKALWTEVAAGRINALGPKWVPWYNLHKTFAGLRDAYLVGGNKKARELLIKLGDWCEKVTSGLSDDVMQRMLGTEHGGMNEVLADIYSLTGDEKYMKLARRFCHKSVIDPLIRQQDRLTRLHANTQIPKIVGLEWIAQLAGDKDADAGAEFFWQTVTTRRTVAFGGNSVSESFNPTNDFNGMLQNREGPETCNTHNMLRLTEKLFAGHPKAAYMDYYERALYNHILASINPTHPGYVYFTPIRPAHYRVYSVPDQCFWCCVGTGMENPGKYAQLIYARAKDGLYVNLFTASEVTVSDLGLVLRQETSFPDEARTRLNVKLKAASTFAMRIRHPAWVAAGEFKVRVNGAEVAVTSTPSSYAEIRREWRDGDRVEIELPMRTTVERLPDGSDWVAFLRGPVVLVASSGTNNQRGMFANNSRMGHSPSGPQIALDQVPVLFAKAVDLPSHVVADKEGGSLHFRLKDVVEPGDAKGLELQPFFRLHEQRYQMYWRLASKEGFTNQQTQLAADERVKAAREAATLDWVAVGEQQPEVEHLLSGDGMETGVSEGRRWRQGKSFQYALSAKGAKAADLVVTYWGGENGRTFDIFANDTLLATEQLSNAKPGQFIEKRYTVPANILSAASVTIKFVGKGSLAGGVYDVRLMKPAQP
jgi:uncharacterized protein